MEIKKLRSFKWGQSDDLLMLFISDRSLSHPCCWADGRAYPDQRAGQSAGQVGIETVASQLANLSAAM